MEPSNDGILLNSNFLYNFFAKNVGRKVVYDVARQKRLFFPMIQIG